MKRLYKIDATQAAGRSNSTRKRSPRNWRQTIEPEFWAPKEDSGEEKQFASGPNGTNETENALPDLRSESLPHRAIVEHSSQAKQDYQAASFMLGELVETPRYLQNLHSLTDAELVSFGDCQEKKVEVERRLTETPEANQLSYRFLAADEQDHDETLRALEALVHLIGRLLKEQRIRRMPRQPGDDSWKDTIREQIEMAICVQLLPVKSGRSAQEITLAALQGGFGDLDSRILSELKTEGNAHRQAVRTRRKPSITESPSMDFVIAVDEQSHQLSFGDTVGLETLIPRCALGSVSTLDEAIEFVTSNRQEIVDAIGRSSYRALLLFMEFAAREETTDLTYRESERTLTEYLQKRGVSPQQARKDKGRFRKAMSDALKAQNPAILELTNLLRESRKAIFEDLVS